MLSIKGHVVSCPLPQAYQEAASLFLQNNMGIVHKEYLDSEDSDNNKRIYACSECHTHLSTYDRIISTAFTGLHGKAYLFQDVVNVFVGQPEEKRMTTGMHTIRDIHCVACGMVVGWKYIKAFESSQKYKEGRFILERELVSEV